MNRIKVTGLLAGVAVLGACAPTDPIYTQFFRPAGVITDTGRFGEATQQNIGVQSGEIQYAIDLARRFAEEAPSTVNFAFNSADLDTRARNALIAQADWIKTFPEVNFRVFGHTDAVGSAGYNKSLGLRRANAVVNFLVAQGIDRGRLEAVVSAGETQPLIVTDGRERRNRRTVTEVSGFIRSNPLVLDGKYAEIVYREYTESAEFESQLRTLQEDQVEEQAQ